MIITHFFQLVKGVFKNIFNIFAKISTKYAAARLYSPPRSTKFRKILYNGHTAWYNIRYGYR